MTISVLQYGVGNLGSVVNMLRRIDVPVSLISTPDELAAAERVLLPGVGAFDRAVTKLQDAGLFDALKAYGTTGRPLLGICLGMQLLMDASDEGVLPGLGLIPGSVRRFEARPGLRVPHMGWNSVRPVRADALFEDAAESPRFYFVHSYHVVPRDESDVLATTPHGGDFVSMVRREDIVGAQFHPEKSHAYGMRLLANFATL